jgi:hypothetical protein
MDHHQSFGSTPLRHLDDIPRDSGSKGRGGELRGNAINYPGNPHFHPSVVFKIINTAEAMDQRQLLLSNHALVISNIGPMGIQSRDEVKTLIMHHFGIRKHELYVYRSCPEPFIVIFSKGHARDLVFAAGRLIDGPIELFFHA